MEKTDIDLFAATFRSEQVESDYRREFASVDKWKSFVGLLMLALPVVIFIRSDYFLFGYSPAFTKLIVVRSIALFFLIASLYTVLKSDNFRFRDRLILISLSVCCCAVFYVNLSRPSYHFLNSLIDIVYIFSFYILIPNRFYFQIVPAIILTLMDFYVFRFHREPTNTLVSTVFWFSFLFVNILGLWTAWHLHIYRRRQYKSQVEIQQTNEKLQQALQEVKTLQGILPLCSYCKKIRNEQGDWEEIDAYIYHHSDADISHGICPECFQKYHPDD